MSKKGKELNEEVRPGLSASLRPPGRKALFSALFLGEVLQAALFFQSQALIFLSQALDFLSQALEKLEADLTRGQVPVGRRDCWREKKRETKNLLPPLPLGAQGR